MAPSTFDRPSLLRTSDAIRLSYELPHRVYDAKLYPITASNGSKIIIYGRDGGLTVLWRGGRRLRAHRGDHQRQQKRQKHQTRSAAGRISLDSDDDEDAYQGNQAFEDEEEEQDAAAPYDGIAATHDINLECSVYSIAVASLPPDTTQNITAPHAFHNHIVVAAACSDNTVNLIKLPLDPSSTHRNTKAHDKTAHSTDVQRVEVTASEVHSSVPRGVALTYTSENRDATDNDSDVEMDGQRSARKRTDDAWQLLVASHSWGTVGLLAISRLQLGAGQDDFSSKNKTCSTGTVLLSNKASTLMFNPVRYPTQRHSRLLLAENSGAVRIFETATSQSSSSNFQIRSNNRGQHQQPQTKLLATFFAPYLPESGFIGTRHKILDVAWALHGKCIMVLLDDGRWGIWDYAGAGPRDDPKRASSNPQSIPNTGATQFTIEGRLALASENDQYVLSGDVSSTKKTSKTGSIALAPMTPNTRKTRQESLFTAQTGGLKPNPAITGSISVSSITNADVQDESVVIAYGQDFFTVPRLVALWKRTQDSQKVKAAGSKRATLSVSALQRVTSLSTLGEVVSSISQFPNDAREVPRDFVRDVLVSAEHRLVVWCPNRSYSRPSGQLATLFSRPSQPSDKEQAIQRSDQDRLHRGDLTLAGVDRMLTSMGGGQALYT